MVRNSSLSLTEHPHRSYGPVGRCIYCNKNTELSDEHIIPFAFGGRLLLRSASCRLCARITGKFEGNVARKILGPLRILYNMPTRRMKDRPKHLPVKYKTASSVDWETIFIQTEICPIIVGLPLYPPPRLITGEMSGEERGAATRHFWIRAANADHAHLEMLCRLLRATEINPEAHIETESVCLMLMKIAHSFAVAELGIDGFIPILPEKIRAMDLSDRVDFLGGGEGNEEASSEIHELSFDDATVKNQNILVVRIRLLAQLGTPTYRVVVGQRLEAARGGAV